MTWLSAIGAAWQWLQRLPQWVWGLAIGLLLIAGVRWVHLREVELAVHSDRTVRAIDAKRELDSLMGIERERARVAVERATTQTTAAWATRDSAVRRTRQLEAKLTTSQQRLTAALAALPDSTARQPGVATLVQACSAVAQDCESLRTQVQQERAAVDEAKAKTEAERTARERAEAVADKALRTAGTRIADEIRRREQAEHRPTKAQLVISTVLGALAGFFTGKH